MRGVAFTTTLLSLSLVTSDVRIIVQNNCRQTIWPAVFGRGGDIPEDGGFELGPGAIKTLNVPDGWYNARIWARTGCKGEDESFSCLTGGCGRSLKCRGMDGETPASWADFTLAKDGNHRDYYDVSYVLGSNIPVTIEPIQGTFDKQNDDNHLDCGKAGECTKVLKDIIKEDLKFKKNGITVGTLRKITPGYLKELKKVCPTTALTHSDAYTAQFTCTGNGKTSADYKVTFCLDNRDGWDYNSTKNGHKVAERSMVEIFPSTIHKTISGLKTNDETNSSEPSVVEAGITWSTVYNSIKSFFSMIWPVIAALCSVVTCILGMLKISFHFQRKKKGKPTSVKLDLGGGDDDDKDDEPMFSLNV